MINALMRLALSQRVVVIGAAIVLLAVGIFAFNQLDIETYPDPVQPMVCRTDSAPRRSNGW